MNGPVSLTANFISLPGQAIISTPPGAALTVDGAACIAPCIFNWATGTQHTIGTTSPQTPSTGTQLAFSGWSDGGAISHTITAAAGMTYTASFAAQYYLTTTAIPTTAGSVSPPSGWYNSGQVVTITAAGSTFSGFSGGLSGMVNPQNVTMNGPLTITAAFASNVFTATPVFGSIVVPRGGSSTVMFTVSGTFSGQSSGGGNVAVKPRIKRGGEPRSDGGGFSIADAILNGTCYSNGNSSLNMAINQAVQYISSQQNSMGFFSGAFWATFSAQSSAPVPGPFVFTCTCEYYGCSLGIQPVSTVAPTPTPQITGVSPTPWEAGTTIPDVDVSGTNLNGGMSLNIAWDNGISTSYQCIGSGGTNCHAFNITVPSDAVGTAMVSIGSSVSGESLLGGANGGEMGSNTLEVEVDAASPARVTLTRDALLHFSAVGSPAGGAFEYVTLPLPTDCGIGYTCPTPVLTLDAGVNASSNPGSGSLKNRPNPCYRGAACPGLEATVRADYQYPANEQFQLPSQANFTLPVLGTSCYYTLVQSQYGTAPNACIGSPSGHQLSPLGLPPGDYCNSFLENLRVEGSAVLADGTTVQYWGDAYHTLPPGQQLTGSSGTPVIPNQTLAFDPTVVPNLSQVTLNGVPNPPPSGTWQANDSGGGITGFRVDLYRGVGPSACTGSNAENVMAIASCKPTNVKCPASTGVFQTNQ